MKRIQWSEKRTHFCAGLFCLALLSGCGDGSDSAPSTPAEAPKSKPAASAPPPSPPSKKKPNFQKQIAGVISVYLGRILDEPGSERSPADAAVAVNGLSQAAQGAPEKCLKVVRATQKVIENTSLDAEAKRQRVLDTSFPIYARC